MLGWLQPRMSAPMSSSSSASTLEEQQYLPSSMLSDNCVQQFLLNDPYTEGLNLKRSCCCKESPTLSINYGRNAATSPLSQSPLSEVATKVQHITMPFSLSSNLQSFSEQLSESIDFQQGSGLSLPLIKDWAAYQNAVGCGGSYTQLLTSPASFATVGTFPTMPQQAHALKESSQRLCGGILSRTVSDAASAPIFVSNLAQCLEEMVIQQRQPLSGTSWSGIAGIVPEQNIYNGRVECVSQYPFELGYAEQAARISSLTRGNFSSLGASWGVSHHVKATPVSDPGMLASVCEDIKDQRCFSSMAGCPEHKSPQTEANLCVDDVPKSISAVSMKKKCLGSDDAVLAGKRPKGEEQGGEVGDAGKRLKWGSSSKVKEEGKGKINFLGEAGTNVGGKDKPSKATDAPKQDYIHVRARRGQATDSHSLAERVRREKISERMRLLQDLVPGCSKITGKAMMLDEIINYVQSLQHQVEFLSMKLAALSPRIDFNFDNIFMGEVMPPSGSSTEVNVSGSEISYQIFQSSLGAAVRDSAPENFCAAPIPSESSLIDIKATSRSPTMG